MCRVFLAGMWRYSYRQMFLINTEFLFFQFFFIRVLAGVRARACLAGWRGGRRLQHAVHHVFISSSAENFIAGLIWWSLPQPSSVAGKVLCRRRQTVPAVCRPSTALHCLLYQIRVKVSQSVAVEPFLGLVTRI